MVRRTEGKQAHRRGKVKRDNGEQAGATGNNRGEEGEEEEEKEKEKVKKRKAGQACREHTPC